MIVLLGGENVGGKQELEAGTDSKAIEEIELIAQELFTEIK
ncbi:hypothetical protein TRE132_08630 [Pseudomonas chlororaphis subsp. aurantiaca]|nr:hypothetical protein C4K32_0904 [Pseudomonas chlororaphis subsp. piscium]AZD96772.1 hypothetical protein C4K12_0887 [Pseudomonas chlororaphis subsp. aureofaciens]BBN52738.1 hypothetical protein TRE132_08630 [Pseudomonas chlororaphis subsp. aurantiaca]